MKCNHSQLKFMSFKKDAIGTIVCTKCNRRWYRTVKYSGNNRMTTYETCTCYGGLCAAHKLGCYGFNNPIAG